MSRPYPDNGPLSPNAHDYRQNNPLSPTSARMQQYQSHNQSYSSYSSEHKAPPADAYAPEHDATYPPSRSYSKQQEWTIQSPRLPYGTTSGGHSAPSMKTYGSSVDLETLATDERPIQNITAGSSQDVETGWRAALWPRSQPCRAYIVTVVVEMVVDMVIEAVILQQLDMLQDTVPTKEKSLLATNSTRQPIYLGIFVLAHFLQSVLAIDAVYNKNTLQFLFLAVFNFMLLIYGIMQIVEVQDNIKEFSDNGASAPSVPVHTLINIIPCVIAIAEVAYIGLGYQIWKDFGWQVYKFLGADRNIKKIYGQYQIFQCLLKFDIFFWVGFSVQWMVLIPLEHFEFYATIAALPLAILLLVEGYLAARHENRWMMGSFMVGCVAGCAYFTYKAWRIFQDKDTDTYKHVWKSLLIFACVSIILLLLTFISATVVMLNFSRGLKENMNKKAKQHKLERRATSYKGSGGRGGIPADFTVNINRMSIE